MHSFWWCVWKYFYADERHYPDSIKGRAISLSLSFHIYLCSGTVYSLLVNMNSLLSCRPANRGFMAPCRRGGCSCSSQGMTACWGVFACIQMCLQIDVCTIASKKNPHWTTDYSGCRVLGTLCNSPDIRGTYFIADTHSWLFRHCCADGVIIQTRSKWQKILIIIQHQSTFLSHRHISACCEADK